MLTVTNGCHWLSIFLSGTSGRTLSIALIFLFQYVVYVLVVHVFYIIICYMRWSDFLFLLQTSFFSTYCENIKLHGALVFVG